MSTGRQGTLGNIVRMIYVAVCLCGVIFEHVI